MSICDLVKVLHKWYWKKKNQTYNGKLGGGGEGEGGFKINF